MNVLTPSNLQDALNRIREELNSLKFYPRGVVAGEGKIPGTAFFPGGDGLVDPREHTVPSIMVVGHDFGSLETFNCAKRRGAEDISVKRGDGYAACSPMRASPTRIVTTDKNAAASSCRRRVSGNSSGRFDVEGRAVFVAANFDADVAALRANADAWARLGIAGKIRHLHTMRANTVAVAQRWMEISARPVPDASDVRTRSRCAVVPGRDGRCARAAD